MGKNKSASGSVSRVRQTLNALGSLTDEEFAIVEGGLKLRYEGGLAGLARIAREVDVSALSADRAAAISAQQAATARAHAVFLRTLPFTKVADALIDTAKRFPKQFATVVFASYISNVGLDSPVPILDSALKAKEGELRSVLGLSPL